MLQLVRLEFRAAEDPEAWPPERLAKARRQIEEERLAQEKVGQAVNRSADNKDSADSEFSFYTSSYSHSDARTEAADETTRSPTRVRLAVLTSLSLCKDRVVCCLPGVRRIGKASSAPRWISYQSRARHCTVESSSASACCDHHRRDASAQHGAYTACPASQGMLDAVCCFLPSF
jgi:hypothetical protein